MCVLSCGDGFASELPTHPTARGRFSPILTHEAAGHVLTTIRPQFSDAQADIYVARGYSAGGGRPVVTAVWFRVDVAKPRTDLRRVFARLRGRVVANANNACGEKGFVASGVYMGSGMGVLAGRGRHSIRINGTARSVPYFRSSISDDEGLLAELMFGVAGERGSGARRPYDGLPRARVTDSTRASIPASAASRGQLHQEPSSCDSSMRRTERPGGVRPTRG